MFWAEIKKEKYQNFLSENFHFSVVKFSVYLNRHVFVMNYLIMCLTCASRIVESALFAQGIICPDIYIFSSKQGPFCNWNLLIFFLFLPVNIFCGVHLKCLIVTLLMSPHNMFSWQNKKIIMWIAHLIQVMYLSWILYAHLVLAYCF